MLTALALFIAIGETNFQEAARKSDRTPVDQATARIASESMAKAIDFLRKEQSDDGSFAKGDFGPSITALALAGSLRTKMVTLNDPMAARGLAYLLKHVQPDGGIYPAGGAQRNYSTAIALLALTEANRDKRYQPIIDAAVAFLKNEQWDETESIDDKDPKYGGAGYGGPKKTRPDLSNTAMMLDALKASGLPEDDPAYKRALVFVRRCQNFSEEGGNDLPIGMKINDGGFYYTPVEEYNPAGKTANQGLRSYGSMTYAGLRSFIHAGLKKDDPRVQAAFHWIRNHYTLEENPGMGKEGLFYYYHTFAKALRALDVDAIEDAKGARHDWRSDFIRLAARIQAPDGSWKNDNKRWFEDNPALVTSYMLLGLSASLE